MSRQTENSFFIVPPIVKYAELYQQLLIGEATYKELGNRILRRIESAQAFRQVEQVRELAILLQSFPVKEYQLIGQYFLTWCDGREAKYDRDTLEKIVEQTVTYKTKAMFSLAAFEGYQGRVETSLYYYMEALKTSPSVSDYIVLSRSIAALKSAEGFQRSAHKDLENLLPLIKHAEPLVYCDFLNSYAVELSEAGCKTEAQNICRVVLASSFAPAYPEWRETGQELGVIGCKEPRSFVSLETGIKERIRLSTEKAKSVSTSKKETKLASVLSFIKLKEAPLPEKPEKVTPRELDEMSAGEKREFILAAVRSDSIRESEYDKMIFMFGLLESGPAAKVMDLEDEAVLDDLVIKWAALIEPEELAAVLSALRDCDDTIRRANILDRMIRKAFEESRTCGLTEEEWRLKVERTLP